MPAGCVVMLPRLNHATIVRLEVSTVNYSSPGVASKYQAYPCHVHGLNSRSRVSRRPTGRTEGSTIGRASSPSTLHGMSHSKHSATKTASDRRSDEQANSHAQHGQAPSTYDSRGRNNLPMENQTPALHGTEAAPSSTSAHDAASSTVFLGEASLLSYANDSADVSAAPGDVGKAKPRLRYTIPPNINTVESPLSVAQSERQSARLDYLKSIGVFNLPSSATCEEILSAYFTWFHPCFPVVDRAWFFGAFVSEKVPPLLMQSMLFNGVCYCDEEVLRRAGFVDRFDARSLFYSHAKDIYDADYETDKLVITQALFLLSFWRAGPQLEKDSRHWLGAAISLAQAQGMHRS